MIHFNNNNKLTEKLCPRKRSLTQTHNEEVEKYLKKISNGNEKFEYFFGSASSSPEIKSKYLYSLCFFQIMEKVNNVQANK